MTYTQNGSKKLLKNRNMCTTLFFFFFNFSLSPPISYFGNTIAKNQIIFFLFPSISAMLLPQTNYNNFFSLLLQQCHCHKFIPTIFFFFLFYFNNDIVTNPFPQFFSPLFRQCHCHKLIATLFFFRNDMCKPFLQQILNDKLFLIIIVGIKK